MSYPHISLNDIKIAAPLQEKSFKSTCRAEWQNRNVVVKSYSLKKLPSHLIKEFEKAFQQEIEQLYAFCQSKQIVQLFGVCHGDDRWSLVMEELDKGSLLQVLHDKKNCFTLEYKKRFYPFRHNPRAELFA